MHDVRFTDVPNGCTATIDRAEIEPGLDFYTLVVRFDAQRVPSPLSLRFTHATTGVHAQWSPTVGSTRGNPPPWAPELLAKATTGAPVHCLHDFAGRNQLTIAVADAVNPVALHVGVHEETATFQCTVRLFAEPGAPIDHYATVLRIDARNVPMQEALQDVVAWWQEMPACEPMPVPDIARMPMYSTWYNFHQNISADVVEQECRLAKTLGCEAVIVDDGWQTDDNKRGYAYCGDWRPTPNKFPDMAAHVRRVHDMGLKYLLWYSVPFVGRHSESFPKFEGKYLGFLPAWDASVLDPRFPDVREYLLGLYEEAVRDWDIDGLKLDFVDSFNFIPGEPAKFGEGRDYDSVPQAFERLMIDAHARLRAWKPDLMIEFRQKYVGPVMRRYGNMFRGHDVPNDPLGNRMETLDIRLLCGNTAAHADMVMWNPDETAAQAALHVLAGLFAVPQISMQLHKLNRAHQDMLKFWLGFWRTHRDVLLDGALTAHHPEAMYTAVRAETAGTELVACYATPLATLSGGAAARRVLLVNATTEPRLLVETSTALGSRRVSVQDCCGQMLHQTTANFGAGVHVIQVPSGGLATLEAI